MAAEPITYENEIWKPVVGFEGRYSVSNFGRLRAHDWVTVSSNGRRRLFPARIMSPPTYSNGYVVATLMKNRTPVRKGLHAIVCEAFISCRPVGCFAAHGNGVRDDNRLENLRWATSFENEADKLIHGTDLRGARHHQALLDVSDVREIRRRRALGEQPASIARSFPVSRSCVQKICMGKIWAWLD